MDSKCGICNTPEGSDLRINKNEDAGTVPHTLGWKGETMKYLKIVFVLAGLLALFGCGGSSGSTIPMTVSADSTISTEAAKPGLLQSSDTVRLQFSVPLDAKTVAANAKLYKITTTGALEEVSCTISVAPDAPDTLVFTTTDGAMLPEGTSYKVMVGKNLRSIGNSALAEEYNGYFDTAYELHLGATSAISGDLGQGRGVVVVISDIHLGDQRSIDQGYGWNIVNRKPLVDFLESVRTHPNIKELVIAGDLFDEWVAPMEMDTFNGKSESDFVDSIVVANQSVIDAINKIIADHNITVSYVPGNHDMFVTTDDDPAKGIVSDMSRIFPGIHVGRKGPNGQAKDARGLGTYSPAGYDDIIIEHGHRYDFFNAPDMLSNRDRLPAGSDAILPPGFFVSKLVTTNALYKSTVTTSMSLQPLVEQDPLQANPLYYKLAWGMIFLTQTDINNHPEQLSQLIKTGIDGYTQSYPITKVTPQNQNNNDYLYSDIDKNINNIFGGKSNWELRQENNLVLDPHISIFDGINVGNFAGAMAIQAKNRYLDEKLSNKKVVVFGHTHVADVKKWKPLLQHKDLVYANSGTWVDDKYAKTSTKNYVTIFTDMKGVKQVSAWQYNQSATTKDKQIAGATIK
jgi:UDP-2,3-diacylglucosamine pyrophosphatase LpxH